MFSLETSKAGLTKLEFDLLDYIEYPKTLEQIKNQFPDVNVAEKVLRLIDKGLVSEQNSQYFSKFYTQITRKIIDDANVKNELKSLFHFFLSNVDNPIVRNSIFGRKVRVKTEEILSVLNKSAFQELTKKEMVTLELDINYLVSTLSKL